MIPRYSPDKNQHHVPFIVQFSYISAPISPIVPRSRVTSQIISTCHNSLPEATALCNRTIEELAFSPSVVLAPAVDHSYSYSSPQITLTLVSSQLCSVTLCASRVSCCSSLVYLWNHVLGRVGTQFCSYSVGVPDWFGALVHPLAE